MASPFEPHADAAAPRSLRARLLGPPDVQHAGRPLAIARSRNRLVFYLLATRLESVSRDWLYGLLWPDASEEHARRSLTQALTQLRTSLVDPEALGQSREAVWLDRTRAWSDVAAVDGMAGRRVTDRSTGDLETVVALYRGRFLDGVACAHHAELEDWMLSEADRLETVFLQAQAELIHRHAATGRTLEATTGAERYLRINPIDERMHRQLMALYAAADDRNAAIAHFRRCTAVLKRELGVAPEPATRAAYQEVVNGRGLVGRVSDWSLTREREPAY